VLASPASAKSLYVREEILAYKRIHGEGRVLALVVDGQPEASFPDPLKFRIGEDGQLSMEAAEPIAADMRPEGDGRRLAFLKIVAGMTGLKLDDLVQREAQRRTRRMTMVAAGACAGMLLTSGLALYAEQQRRVAVEQRQIAERETEKARAATDYLIGTFELVDPATENPRTVSLVTLLERGAERAAEELRDQPEIEARLVASMGRAYNNLGLLDEAEVALARALPAIKRAGADGASALVTLADTRFKKGELDRAWRTLSQAEGLLGSPTGDQTVVRARIEATRGTISYGRGEADKALAFTDRALALLRSEAMPDRRQEAVLLDGRGRSLVDLGRLDEAQASLAEAGALFRRHFGERHLWTGRNEYARALAAYNAGDSDAALAHIRTSLAILSKVLDQTNPIRADALALEGSIHQERNDFVQAERSLIAAIDGYRAVYGGLHYNIGIAEYYRAMIAFKQGRNQQALDRLREAEINYVASYGKVHPNIGELMVMRAEVLADLGRGAESRQQCAAGLKMVAETMGGDASFTRGLRATCERLGK
jgi:tetratricopeptide (TPR) repeat protein